jgi:uncharacterized protein
MSFDANAIRAAVEKDFQNREFAQNISLEMVRVVRFLNTFHTNVRGRLADLNQKLTQVERRLTSSRTSLSRARLSPASKCPTPTSLGHHEGQRFLANRKQLSHLRRAPTLNY